MRSIYITVEATHINGKTSVHNYRAIPSQFHLEGNETVVKVREGSWPMTELVPAEQQAALLRFKRSLSGVATRG